MAEAFRRIQIGAEATRGTLVAADKVLLGTLQMTPESTFFRPEDERNSIATHSRQVEVAQQTTFRYEGVASFEQLIYFLSMGVIGAVSPATVEVTGRVWTFLPNMSSANTPNSFSIEYGDDDQEFEAGFVVATNLEMAIAMGETMTLRADLVGREAAKSTFTGALSEPAINEIVGNKMNVWIDGTWANLGTTAKTSLVAAASIRLPTGFTPVKYADGNLFFSAIAEQKRAVQLELDLVMGADAITEYDAFKAGTARAIRLRIDGPIAVGATNYRFDFDVFGFYDEAPQLFDSRDGENLVRLRLSSFDDKVGPNDFQFVVTNLETTI